MIQESNCFIENCSEEAKYDCSCTQPANSYCNIHIGNHLKQLGSHNTTQRFIKLSQKDLLIINCENCISCCKEIKTMVTEEANSSIKQITADLTTAINAIRESELFYNQMIDFLQINDHIKLLSTGNVEKKIIKYAENPYDLYKDFYDTRNSYFHLTSHLFRISYESLLEEKNKIQEKYEKISLEYASLAESHKILLEKTKKNEEMLQKTTEEVLIREEKINKLSILEEIHENITTISRTLSIQKNKLNYLSFVREGSKDLLVVDFLGNVKSNSLEIPDTIGSVDNGFCEMPDEKMFIIGDQSTSCYIIDIKPRTASKVTCRTSKRAIGNVICYEDYIYSFGYWSTGKDAEKYSIVDNC